MLVGDLCRRFPRFRIIGGCCATDLRHLQCMAEQTRPAVAA